VFVDRSGGDLKLLDGFTVPPADKTGAGQWIVAGLPPGDPGSPTTLRFDLAGIAASLGITMTPSATGFGVRREFLLADGRRVVAEGVLGTAGWFGPDAVAGLDQPTTPTGAPLGPLVEEHDEPSKLPVVLAVTGASLVLFAMVLIVVVRRRRRRARGDAADRLDAIAEETAQHRAVRRQATGETPAVEPAVDPPEVTAAAPVAHLPHGADEPVWADDRVERAGRPVMTAPEAVSATDGASSSAGAATPDPEPTGAPELRSELVPEGAALPQAETAAEPQPEPQPAPAGPRRAPTEALAALVADFDELTTRLQRLKGTAIDEAPAAGDDVADPRAAAHGAERPGVP
jgi:hypothetical protein